MTDVQSTAVLAEATVQKVAAGEVEERKRRGRGKDRRPRQQAPEEKQLHPGLVKMMKDLDIPIGHVQVLATNDIIIWNHAAPWPELS